MKIRLVSASFVALLAAVNTAFAADGDAKRGAQLYRACVACHSLEPGVNLSGPSLAGLWDKPAGKTAGFVRYSRGLKSADFAWTAEMLFAWVADPQVVVPATYMSFRGIEDEQQRADIVAFLKLAMAPGGDQRVVEQSLLPAPFVRGHDPRRSPRRPTRHASQRSAIAATAISSPRPTAPSRRSGR